MVVSDNLVELFVALIKLFKWLGVLEDEKSSLEENQRLEPDIAVLQELANLLPC